MYSTLVFDLDGTLINTLDDLASAGNYALRTLGYPVHKPQDYRLMVGNGISSLVSKMMPADKQDKNSLQKAYNLFVAYYSSHATDQTAPYPGICDLLQNLKEQGHSLAVLSNKNHSHTQNLVSHYFGSIFDAVVGLREPYRPKPDPGSLLSLLEQFSTAPSSALFCGDSSVDILTAKAAKLDSCAVLWGFRNQDELQADEPNYFVNSADEILKIANNSRWCRQ